MAIDTWAYDYVNLDAARKQGLTGKNIRVYVVEPDGTQHLELTSGIIKYMAPDAEIIRIDVGPGTSKYADGKMLTTWLNSITEGPMYPTVVSCSLLVYPHDELQAKLHKIINLGYNVVASAGNNSSQYLLAPAKAKKVITVGSIGRTGERSEFSNYGTGVDLYAPGEDVYVPTDPPSLAWGTSFSSPMVAGAVALLLQKYMWMEPPDVERHILNTSKITHVGRILDIGALCERKVTY